MTEKIPEKDQMGITNKVYNDMVESTNILQKALEKNVPLSVRGMLKSLEGSFGFSQILARLIVEAMNKGYANSISYLFTEGVSHKRLNDNMRTIAFFTIVSTLGNTLFLEELLFKAILKEKNLKIPRTLDPCITEISKIANLTETEKEILIMFKEVRNSVHNNFIYNQKTELKKLDLNGFTYSGICGKPLVENIHSAITNLALENSKVIKTIIEKIF